MNEDQLYERMAELTDKDEKGEITDDERSELLEVVDAAEQLEMAQLLEAQNEEIEELREQLEKARTAEPIGFASVGNPRRRQPKPKSSYDAGREYAKKLLDKYRN